MGNVRRMEAASLPQWNCVFVNIDLLGLTILGKWMMGQAIHWHAVLIFSFLSICQQLAVVQLAVVLVHKFPLLHLARLAAVLQQFALGALLGQAPSFPCSQLS